MRALVKLLTVLFAAVLASAATLAGAVLLFLGAAGAGSAIDSRSLHASDDGPRDVEIVLLGGLLHTDILLPARPDVRRTFAFAAKANLPITADGLRWLSVGWGSRAFYTTAGSYGDIELRTAWRAMTGDDAVMRLVGFGPLADGPDLRRVRLSEAGFARLLAYMRASLERDGAVPRVVEGASLQPGDAFYEAEGRFNIFRTCNEWAREGLRQAGLRVGRWTPTTFALMRSIED